MVTVVSCVKSKYLQIEMEGASKYFLQLSKQNVSGSSRDLEVLCIDQCTHPFLIILTKLNLRCFDEYGRFMSPSHNG